MRHDVDEATAAALRAKPFPLQAPHALDFARTAPNEGRRCRVCGCTDTNACVVDGLACYWIEPGLCSSHQADTPAEPISR